MKKFWQNIHSALAAGWGVLSIPARELLYLLLNYLLLWGITYLLIALYGFSLSYAKIWPPLRQMGEPSILLLLLVAGHFLCRRSPWYFRILFFLHFLVLFALTAIYVTTGTFFCESVLYLVYDTSLAETKDFLTAYVSMSKLLSLVALLIGGLVIGFLPGKLYQPEKRYCRGDFYAVLLILLFSVPFLPGNAWSQHPFAAIVEQIETFHHHAGSFTREMRHRQMPDIVERVPSSGRDAVIGVVVIGESAIRSHHSLYGYRRCTTPKLDSRQAEIIAFDDVITVLPMTITALKYFLTDITLENRHVSWTLFDALNAAGYRSDVLTNQNRSGWADSPLQMIFSGADSVTYLHEENFSDLAEDDEAAIYDENLLPPIAGKLRVRQADNDTPYVLVVHLFGSHEPFHARYPKDFSRCFLDDPGFPQRVNEYDTSILYSDFVLGKILQMLSAQERPAFLIYFADHGAVCDSDRLRTPNSVEYSAYEIPFLWWTNARFREQHPELIARAVAAKHTPLQCDKAIYGLLEMMAIPLKKEVGSRSFLSPDFVRSVRSVNEGAKPYCREPRDE